MHCCGKIRDLPRVAPVPPDPPPPVELGEATTVVQLGEVDKPAGVVDGTVLVAAVGGDAAAAPPAGWVSHGSALFDNIFAGFNWETEIFVHVVVDASLEPASYNFVGAANWTDIWMVAVQNVDNALPVSDATAEPAVPTSGLTSNGASCAVARNGSLLLRFEAANAENRSAGPAGMTALPGSPIDVTFNADSEAVNAGATGDRDSTYTNPQTWTVHMVVLQPVP